jgi:hypothetical protein
MAAFCASGDHVKESTVRSGYRKSAFPARPYSNLGTSLEGVLGLPPNSGIWNFYRKSTTIN